MSLLQRAGHQLSGWLIPRDGFINSIRDPKSPVKKELKKLCKVKILGENLTKRVARDGTRCRIAEGKSEGGNSVQPELPNLPPAGWIESFESHRALKNPNARKGIRIFWCERWDSNPHGITTRTSNVLVYHSNTLANVLKYYNPALWFCQYLFEENP